MLSQRAEGERKEDTVVVAIDKDKGSQYALKWAVDNLLGKGKNVTLLHISPRPSSGPHPGGNHIALPEVSDNISRGYKNDLDSQARELFLPFRCFCTRKDIRANEVVVEDMDVVKAICDYVEINLVENLVIVASTRSGLVRKFKTVCRCPNRRFQSSSRVLQYICHF